MADRKEQLIDAVEKIIGSCAHKKEIEAQRFPTPREFAVEVVEFMYGLAAVEEEREK